MRPRRRPARPRQAHPAGGAREGRRLRHRRGAARARSSRTQTSRRTSTRPTSGSCAAPASASAATSTARVTLADLAAEACTMRARRTPAATPPTSTTSSSATLTPDRLMPGLAPAVAELIGCDLAGAVDVNAACAGFLYAPRPGRRARRVRPREARRSSAAPRRSAAITDHARPRHRDPLRRRRRRGRRRRPASSTAAARRSCCAPTARHADLLYADLRRAPAADGGPRGLPPRRRADGRGDARGAAARRASTIDDVDLLRRPPGQRSASSRPPRGASACPRRRSSSTSTRSPTRRARRSRSRCARPSSEGRLKPGDTVAMATFGAGFVVGRRRHVVEGARPCHRLRTPSRS